MRRLIHQGKLRIKSEDESESGDDQTPSSIERGRSRSRLTRQRSFDANKLRQRDRIVNTAIAPLHSPSGATAEGGDDSSPSAEEASATTTATSSSTAAGDIISSVSGSRVQQKGSDVKEEKGVITRPSGSQRFLPTSRGRGSRTGSKIGKSRYKKRYFFLFDDILLETEPEKDARYRFIGVYPLLDHFIASATEGTYLVCLSKWADH